MRNRKKRRSTYKVYARRNWAYRNKVLLIAIGAFIVLVIAAAVFFFVYTNRKKQAESEIKYEAMTAASLPTVEFVFADKDINLLHGYTDDMDIHYIRRNVYVLQDTYDIPVKINLYGNSIASVDFTVTDADSDNLIQTGSSADLNTEEDEMTCTLKMDNLIDDGKEYILDITLTCDDGKNIHYYTRVLRDTTSPLKEQIELAEKFNKAIYSINNDESEEFVLSMLSTNYWYNDNTDFSDITLYSSISGISWGTMKVSVASDINMEVLDIDGEIAHLLFSYRVSRNEDETTEYYDVSEYYRVRLTDTYEYVLDYDRTVDEIFDPQEEDVMGTKSAKLGIISDKDVNMMCNRAQTLSCFVANNTLWAMETETKTLKRIFSFSSGTDDERGNYDQHDVRLIKVSDEGDIQFIVYGYMNAGIHEGKVGIGMYTYHADREEVEEEIFIPSAMPYEILKNSVGDLFYLNSDNDLYVIMDKYLYKMNLDNDEAELITDTLEDGTYKIHYDNHIIAWQDGGKENDAKSITVLNMETEKSYKVKADSGCCIKVLGFLNEELVYGQGTEGELMEEASGTQYLLMKDMKVVDDTLEVQTEVSAGDGWYTGAVDEYNRVVLKKVVKTDEGYTASDDYTLFANEIEAYPEMETYSEYEEVKRTVYYAVFADSTTSAGTLNINTNAKVLFTDEKTVDVTDMLEDSGMYYVYAKGEVISIEANPADAIELAYDQRGIVLKADGSLFYKRGIIPSSVELSSTTFDNAIRNIAEDKLINVTGITLTEAMYYTGSKIPIVWEHDGESFIFFGYDSNDNITMYNIATNEKVVLTWDYLDSIFQTTGHTYVVDIEE